MPETLRDDVLAARSPAGVDRAALKEAAAHADEGVRSIVDSLTSLRRVLGYRSSGQLDPVAAEPHATA